MTVRIGHAARTFSSIPEHARWTSDSVTMRTLWCGTIGPSCSTSATPTHASSPEDGNHPADFTDQQRNMAVVQVVELFVQDDHLVCDRNAPVSWPV